VEHDQGDEHPTERAADRPADDEHTGERRESAAVTRSQNVVLTLPHTPRAVAQFIAPALERLDGDAEGTQLLVLTADPETTIAVAQAAARLSADGAAAEAARVLPVTNARRGERLVRGRPAPAVVGTPAEIAALVRGAALKLESVSALIVAWAEDVLAAGDAESIEAVMAEVPKSASRTVVVEHESEEVAAFVERYLRRPRRVGGAPAAPDETQAPVAVHYVSVAPIARPAALRRLLDELDPPSAVVVTGSPESEREVRDSLRSLGYVGDEGPVRVTSDDVTEHAALVVLYDLPATRAELERAVGAAPVQTVALVQPRQIGHLRAVAGARVTALTLPEPAVRARGREERLRAELRALLANGAPAREVLALEPLLDEFDGIEIAAAALRLAERERDRARSALTGAHTGFTPKAAKPAAPARPEPEVGTGQQWRRVFMSVGHMDGVTPGDLVGAITGEAAITSDRLGRIELRDTHALVEVAADDADRVIERMNGVSVRGRRVVARVDQDRPPRDGGAGRRAERSDRSEGFERRERSDQPRRSFDREGGDRPVRGDRGPRGDRGFDRGERGDRGDRPARGFAGSREERPRRSGFDRGDRFERGERGDRGFDRGDRGGRGFGRAADRGDRGDRGDRFGRGERFERNDRFARDDRPGRRPGPSERAEWADRGERLRNARPRRPGTDRGRGVDRNEG
jgi:ATP-dependent RNA helicase DeaD